MSRKDVEKGIEIQARIHAKKEQKVEKGMKVLEEKLEDIAEAQDAGFELVDVVLVFHLGIGECGHTAGAPVDGIVPFVDESPVEQFNE